MRRIPALTYLWPGLPQIWAIGSWSGLGAAVGFSALVNLGLCATLLWRDLLPGGVRTALWMFVGVYWLVSIVVAARWMRRFEAPAGMEASDDPYSEAMDHYLKGNWYEAEQALLGWLRRHSRDIEANLLLATLYRHTQRIEEAREQLARLERLEGCWEWESEIAREKALVAEEGEAEIEPSDDEEPDREVPLGEVA